MTNTGTAELTIDELMAQAGWLHRLAAGLLRDPATAEDAAQDALVAALRHPPDARGSVRGWFGTVLSNRIRSDSRSATRRQRTVERAAAEPLEATRTPEDIVAALELQRLVASEVLALDEPYRQVVYLRYFDELDSAEIAARLAVPAGTVRWRLKTAIDQLRARLDARDGAGGWRRILAPLAGAGVPRSKAAPGAAGAPLLAAPGATAIKLGAAALAVAVFAGGGTLLWSRLRAPAADAAAIAQTTSTLAPPAFVGQPPSADEPPPPRTAAAVASAAAGGGGPGGGGARGDRPVSEAKIAPFSGMRWKGDVPEVQVNGTWFRLTSIDGIPAGDIVAHARKKYGRLGEPFWRTRMSEDLVAVLHQMGKPPRWQVALGLESLTDGARTVVSAEMTKENRQAALALNRIQLPIPELESARPGGVVRRFAHVSPFHRLRFAGEVVEVELPGEPDHWYRLVSVDGRRSEDLVAYAKRRDPERWRRRIAEDLFEVLSGLGARVGAEVDVAVQELPRGAVSEHRKVPLTEDNRKRIKATWQELSR